MADKKQLMRDFVMWGTESDKNRQEAIDAACRVISALYSLPSGKKLTEKEQAKLAGGGGCYVGTCSNESGFLCDTK